MLTVYQSIKALTSEAEKKEENKGDWGGGGTCNNKPTGL